MKMYKNSNFIKNIIQKDLDNQKYKEVITRFPPEPNGFLHLGHARAIVINFELAKYFKGKTYLRYDDTNPMTEEKQIYMKAILEDVKWLGYRPHKIFFASDYFDIMYEKAVFLIKKGKAFVDDLNKEQLKKFRRDLFQPGLNSPYRERSIQENLKLFEQMKKGFFKEGEKVLRAKIDMSSSNMNLRDPVLYRVLEGYTLKNKHYFIFPSYDFAHPLEDSIEKITHSLCSFEFEDHRPLYKWVLQETEMPHKPTQIEFGRLNISHTCLSKRFLKTLVNARLVNGWDDPRMPTLSGVRKKGYTAEAICHFVLETGLSKNNTYVQPNMLYSCLRNDLQLKTKKVMTVIEPLKVTIINYPVNQKEFRDIDFNNKDTTLGSRPVFFSKYLYIEKNDFQIEKKDPQSKKLFLNGEVRLFYFYFIKAVDVIKNNQGEIIEILAIYDPETKSGNGFNKRKPNGTIHFVEATTAQPIIVNFYDNLFKINNPKNILEDFNHASWRSQSSLMEGSVKLTQNQEKFQFLRQGYFHLEKTKELPNNFNEIISLKKIDHLN
ncbi:Glutaminyl-tRNA synthetase [Candidatus Phytoplasma phoenicium]|uniref:Glutamine--tRNA ligase n=2 Tax=Candidatus Phytoplasma phoenicium TaxID=198422 RepID=A0A0L0MJS6_9MOLU|nr:Glutaminyl-tRNA synthetase [Candidatus Phytoplasma phoenicium]